MTTAWSLVGRAEELDFAVASVAGDASRGIVVAGEAGVGKTRLAREAVAALGPGFAVEWTAATPASARIPFGAFSHLLPEPDAAVEDRLRLLRRTAALLCDRAAGKPLLLAVDDVQWLDPGAVALVHQLVVTDMARVLLTLRTGEQVTDPVVGLWKDGFVERLELQPLAPIDVETLVVAALGGPVERPTVRRFWELSGGNALFLRELVAGGTETNALACEDGIWRWRGRFQPSTRLATILEERLGRMSRAGRAVLDHLAVGEPLPLETLAALCDQDGIAEVERAGLVLVDQASADVRFAHPLYAEVHRAAMGMVARRAVTARLADAMRERVLTSPGELLRVASWRLESSTPADASLMTEAAQVANSMFDHALAERLARRAVEDGGGLRASLALGDALSRQGRSAEAGAVLEPLARLALSDQDHVDVAVARCFALTTEVGFRPEAERVLLEAETHVGDRRLRAFLRAQRATILAFAGRLTEAIELASATSDDPRDEISQLRAVPALGAAWLCLGKAEAASALATRMFEPAIRCRNELPQAPFWVVSTQLPALVAAGQLEEADQLIALVEAAASASGASADTPSFLALARGLVALHRGQVQTARRWLQEGVTDMRTIARWRLPFPLVHLVEACALAGDADGAAAASAEADEHVAGAAIFEGLVRRARGWVALARGQRSQAVELALGAAAWSGAHAQYSAEMRSLHDAVRFGGGVDPAQKLATLAPRLEGPWARGLAAQATALVENDGKALEAAASQLEEMGALLLAAEAAAQASGAFRCARLDSRAERTMSLARRLADRCEGARSPILDEVERPLPLTSREREVAILAAEGLSSNVIAERLFVSTRTVEGHLYRVYAKLGVRDRRALGRLLHDSSGEDERRRNQPASRA